MKRIGIALTVILLLGTACQRQPSDDVFLNPVVGSVAVFQPYPRWNVSGEVHVVDETTLRFVDFTFNGGEFTTQIRLQKNKSNVAVLKDITDEAFEAETFDIALPGGITLDDFNLVTVYSPPLGVAVSGARFR